MKELNGVKSSLVSVVKRAIQITKQDFSVYDGLRTVEEQRKYVAQGASHTMNSKHITGDAVDLVPYVQGRLLWEWPLIYPIAVAMHQAAEEQGVKLRWGGVWDRSFNELAGTEKALEQAVEDYVARRRAAGKDAFIDGPHYELVG